MTRRLLALAALLLSALPASASWAFVNKNVNATGASSLTNIVTMTNAPAAHQVLVSFWAVAGSTVDPTVTVSGGCNVSWVRLVNGTQTANHLNFDITYCLDAIGSGNVTGTSSVTNSFFDGYVNIYSFTGGATISVDGTPPAGATGTTGNAVTGTVTTTGTDTLVLAGALATTVSAASNSFNLRDSSDGNGVADRIVAVGAGYTTTFTTPNGNWVAVIGALKATTSGTPAPTKPPMVIQ